MLLGQLVGGSGLDVVAATYKTLEVIDVQARALAHRYSDATAAFYPSAVIDRGSSSSATPGAYVYVSGWQNELIYRFDTPDGAPRPVRWNTFMGNNQRTGIR